jgi:hypothetical protein
MLLPAAPLLFLFLARLARRPSSLCRLKIGHDIAIRVISNLAPRQRRHGVPREQWPVHRRELHADADGRAALRQVAGNQEFIIAEPAI